VQAIQTIAEKITIVQEIARQTDLLALNAAVEAARAAKMSLDANDEAARDDLFAHYTMERQRDVHRDFGIAKTPVKVAASASAEEDDGLLLL